MKKITVYALIAAIVMTVFTMCVSAEEATAAVDAGALDNITVTPSNFVNNLSYMGLGMLGIFIVIALIMVVTTVLNKALSDKKNEQ